MTTRSTTTTTNSTAQSTVATRGASVALPALVVLASIGLGAWTYGRIADANTRQVEAVLQASVSADAAALDCWLDARLDAARALTTALAAARDEASLARLAERNGFAAAAVISRDGSVIADAGLVDDGDRLPTRLRDDLAARGPGNGRSLAPMDFGTQRVVPFLVAAAGGQDGAVILAADAASGGFARLLTARRTGETGETYAFDRDGRMLSPSRFDRALQASGLIDEHPLELRNPGVDLARGERPDRERRALPLTALAAAGPEQPSGLLPTPYRGYLGHDVVGAWIWNGDRGYGLATEISAEEAYRSLALLRWAGVGFVLVLVLAGAASAWVAHHNRVLRRRVQAAERKVRQLGQYSLVKKIGEGGMGEVYYARHAMLRRPTAIKLLRPDKTSEETISRFEREVQQTSRLTHHNTIQIFDFGRTPGGTFYYAMEYLRGIPLDEFIEREGPLPEGRVLYILKQVCASLNEAHGLGLIHRDIKPANIALCQAGGQFDVVKVLDFGLVMNIAPDGSNDLSLTNALTGTPHYMAPEAFLRPKTVDARSDLYAVGCVGYYLLTGKTVFEGASVLELLNKPLSEKPMSPSERADRMIQPDVENAILACLERDPDARPQTANALIRELEWCRSWGDWNQPKARHWWADHAERLERTYGLSAKDPSGSKHATIAIDVRRRLDG